MADSLGIISVGRSLEAWEEVQRHGQDLADRLAQGFTGLIQSHLSNPKPFHLDAFSRVDFGLLNHTPAPTHHHHRAAHAFGISEFFDVGNRIGQAGADLGTGLNALVQQLFRGFPPLFKQEECLPVAQSTVVDQDLGLVTQRLRHFGFLDDDSNNNYDVSTDNYGVADAPSQPPPSGSDDYIGGFDLKSVAHLAKPQGTINITSTYDSSSHNIDSSLVARGDLWRVEASHDGSSSTSENSSLFLIQLGPVLFVRDTTLLLPVHLSKQHLLWYGFDRKNGIHSLCPAVWSKHRRWLLMSMLCLNPLACSFVDLQFPNGQLTYISGEGLTTSAFLPLCGGLLQAQGQYPGEMRFSYSRKNKWGTRITPMVQWPDKSLTLGFAQALAWQRSGIMVKPTVHFSLCPTLGGTNPGLRAELIHSVNEQLNLICGCALMEHPSAFASISIGRSKWNGNVGSSGIVVRLDTPLSAVGQPSFSVQINSGVEF